MKLDEFANSLRRRITKMRHLRFTPKNRRSDDIYIVEFPKSGITWLSTIICNAALVQSGSSHRASFSNIQSYIYDIHIDRQIGLDSPFERGPRLLKSHAEFNYHYHTVIYVIRDPVDVMRSYYRFAKAHNPQLMMDFHLFLRDENYGIPAWKRHVKSWLDAPRHDLRLHLVSYENLVENPKHSMEQLSRNMGWGLTEGEIDEALDRSKIMSMKASEELHKKYNPSNRFHFVRGQNDVVVSEEERTWILDMCDNEMKLAGMSGGSRSPK